jgi:hypothetical protein
MADIYKLVHIPCNAWGCEHCGKIKAWRAAKRIQVLCQGHDMRMATLTLENVSDPEAQIRILADSWNRLNLDLKRKIGAFEYIRILEAGELNGRFHYHVLINKFIPQRKLSAWAYHAGFGRIVDIRMVKNNHVAKYVTKYLTKGLQNELTTENKKLPRYRRIVTSFKKGIWNAKPSTWSTVAPVNRQPFNLNLQYHNFAYELHHKLKAKRTIAKGNSIEIHFKEPEEPILGYTKIEQNPYYGLPKEEIPKGRKYARYRKHNTPFVPIKKHWLFTEREERILNAVSETEIMDWKNPGCFKASEEVVETVYKPDDYQICLYEPNQDISNCPF